MRSLDMKHDNNFPVSHHGQDGIHKQWRLQVVYLIENQHLDVPCTEVPCQGVLHTNDSMDRFF